MINKLLCFKFGRSDETVRSFYESQAMCEARGSKLASFHSYNETMAVLAIINNQPSHNLFIGLYSDGYGTLTYFYKDYVVFLIGFLF